MVIKSIASFSMLSKTKKKKSYLRGKKQVIGVREKLYIRNFPY